MHFFNDVPNKVKKFLVRSLSMTLEQDFSINVNFAASDGSFGVLKPTLLSGSWKAFGSYEIVSREH